MIIGVNARFLTKPYTGIGQHTHNLFDELAKQNPNDEFILVTPEKPEGYEHFDIYKNLEIVVLPEKMIGTAGMKKTYWEQVQVPNFLLKQGAEVLLKGVHGVLVPGGFGDRGIQGKINAVRYARERAIPFLGI